MAQLKNLITGFSDSPKKKEEIALTLNLLYELAESKNTIFNNEIIDSLKAAGKEEEYTVPISNIIQQTSGIRAYTSSDSANVVKQAISGVKSIIKGGGDNIADGIGTILGAFINTFFASGAGEEIERKGYFVAVDGLAIVRLDVRIWIRNISISGFSKELESVIAYTAIKSSVDVDAIQFSDFLSAYSSQLNTTNMTLDEKKEELKKMKELFELYSSNASAPDDSVKGSMRAIRKMSNSSKEVVVGSELSLTNLLGGKVRMKMPGESFMKI
ncbi:MAG: hypothetical protein AAFP08_15405 [Bacteroidota bacterium]